MKADTTQAPKRGRLRVGAPILLLQPLKEDPAEDAQDLTRAAAGLQQEGQTQRQSEWA